MNITWTWMVKEKIKPKMTQALLSSWVDREVPLTRTWPPGEKVETLF